MKILELAPYVFIEGHRYGNRNQSGLAYMIRSICDMLARSNEVHVITQSILTEDRTISGWHLAKRNLFSIITHVKIRYCILAIKLYKKDKSISFLKHLFYCLSAGQVDYFIKSHKPDVVHIHGISSAVLPFYLAATNCGAPIISTLHGLVSFNEIVPASDFQKKLERRFLINCVHNDYPFTVISSGMKRKIQELTGSPCSLINVIPNCYRGLSMNNKKRNVDDRSKRIVCVGGLYPLKNQIQVIRVLPVVQDLVSGYIVTLDLFGDGPQRNEMQEFCAANGIQGVTFHGRQSQDVVFDAITNSDLLVFPSIEEGFGIPIIEAYRCGTPVVIFGDLDSAVDVFNEDCCLFPSDRSDSALINAIVMALNKKWNKEKILSFADNFSLKSISNKYNEVLVNYHEIWERTFFRKLLD